MADLREQHAQAPHIPVESLQIHPPHLPANLEASVTELVAALRQQEHLIDDIVRMVAAFARM